MASRAKDWLRQAKRDLTHAEKDLKSSYYEWACFSAQQAAEKAIKALFQQLHAAAWGHSITALMKELVSRFQEAETLLSPAKTLDKYYIQTRYPNGFDVGAPEDYYTNEEAKQAIEDAGKIIRFCESRIFEDE